MRKNDVSARAPLAFAALLLISCGSAGEDEDAQGVVNDLDSAPQWTHCAKQYQHCAFTGTRKVRFGANGKYVTGTFTDGAHCVTGSFEKNPAPGVYKTCEYDASNPDEGSTGDGDPSGGSPGGGMSGMGPYVDVNKIPAADPGSSAFKVRDTSEKPGPGDGTGMFRTECDFSHMNFDDPIVYPGQPGASHLHTFFGNTKANAFSTQSSIKNSGNSTCRGGIANRTSYWVPSIVDKNGVPQKPETGSFYYKSGYGGVAPEDIRPFPSGLRMVAGDKASSSAQSVAYWGCEETYQGHPGSIPTDCPSGEGVVMIIEFPQCWDGVNLDSSNHKSHMKYPSGGGCPSTHPVPIPAITFNIKYRTPNGTAGWRLTSDMYDESLRGGFSVHADWFEGWDDGLVKAFVKNCDNEAVDCHSHLLGDGREIY